MHLKGGIFVNRMLQKLLLGMTLTVIFGGGTAFVKADDVNTSQNSSSDSVLVDDSNSTSITDGQTSLAEKVSSSSSVQSSVQTPNASSSSVSSATDVKSISSDSDANEKQQSSTPSTSSTTTELNSDTSTTSVSAEQVQTSQEGQVLADGNSNTSVTKKAPRDNNTQVAKQTANTLLTTIKNTSQYNLTFYNDVDEPVVGFNGKAVYNNGYNYSYDNLNAVKYNSDTHNDKYQVVNDYANLSQTELREINIFAAQLLNTVRESVWSLYGQDTNSWQLMITNDSMGLAVKVAQGYTRDRHSISSGTHDVNVLQTAYKSYGLHGYSESYGSTSLNYAATITNNRKTTMYNLKKAVFQTLTLMLYDDMPAANGGANAGSDGNGHAYSLAYGWDQYSFSENYFGLAFDQMGQVHIVNFKPSLIWNDTHFDTKQLVYTKTLGDTSVITKSVPTAYSNYLKAAVFKNDSAISYVKEKIVDCNVYYLVTRNGQLNIYDSSLRKLTGRVVLGSVVYNLKEEKNGQYNEGGKWYLYKDGVKQTGFQYIASQNKTVYYNSQGQMQYGQQQIGGKWYLFDQATGAMKTGFQYIADQHKTVYYNNQGQMLYGWQKINGATYYFDPALGTMANGQRNINGYWYNFENGKMSVGFTYLKDENKTVYYNNQGHMLYGWQKINGATYYFDPALGTMANGQRNINGYWYNFVNGKMSVGFTYLKDQNKTVYYNNQGHMVYGWQKINGATYYFDPALGTMANGQRNINGYWYNFVNGKMSVGFTYLKDQNKTVYYNNQGHMVYGWQKINGATYYFDPALGTMANGQRNINGHWYNFVNGKMSVGFTYLSDQHKTVYYNSQGQMQYGQQNINGKWYLFDQATGAMKTGFQYIADQHKTVYYNNQGQMLYGRQTISGKNYYFDVYTGAMK